MWRVCLFVFNHHFPRASDHPLTSGLLALCEQEDTTEITLSAYTHGFGGNVRMTLSLQVLLAGGSGGVPPGFLGYCPQESALWPGLTVREHLEVLAAVKGLQRADAAAAITSTIKVLVYFFTPSIKSKNVVLNETKIFFILLSDARSAISKSRKYVIKHNIQIFLMRCKLSPASTIEHKKDTTPKKVI